jgi:hypothetical protein
LETEINHKVAAGGLFVTAAMNSSQVDEKSAVAGRTETSDDPD